MQSRVFYGSTYHQRFLPVGHSFRYPLHVFAIDLSEIDAFSFPGVSSSHFFNSLGLTVSKSEKILYYFASFQEG